MNDGRKLSFIVADDHPLVRLGVRLVLESEYSESLVVEASDLETVLTAVVTHSDAMLLIDLGMPGMDGAESLRALRQEFPTLLMAVLSANAKRQSVVDALNAGVNGYILKECPPEELLYAISTIHGGHVYLNNVLWRPPGDEMSVAPSPRDAPEPQVNQLLSLTPRQRQVMEWLMKGHSNKQIARDLEIGEGTVKIHLAAVFRQLGAQNRTDAVMIASRLGL
jgi:DNA-binding NarL/FixJ family response regulator